MLEDMDNCPQNSELENDSLSFSFSLSLFFVFFVCLFVCFCSLGPYLRHIEVPRLGIESELQLLVYTTATATQDPSHDLHHSSRQCRILNPFSKARDRTHNLKALSQICFCCATTGTPFYYYFCRLNGVFSNIISNWIYL